jgi:YidC/Oxa1 family membrane protein insertase
MSKPAAKGNFMQTLLIAAVIFMGLQLFMMSNRPAETRSADEYMQALRTEVSKIKAESAERSVPIAQVIQERESRGEKLQLRMQVGTLNVEQSEELMRYQNELGLDLTIAQYLGFHQGKIAREADQQKWDARRKLEKEITALLLTADTQYRQGIARGNNNRQDLAFLTLQGQAHKFQGTPSWRETVYELPALRGGEVRRSTAKDFFTDLVAKLSARSKTDLIMGVIPGYRVIDALVAVTGRIPSFSYAFAALLLAVLVRGIVWPLSQKQYMFGRQMAQLSPLVKEIKERFTDKKTGQITDPQKFQKETMDLYREYGINPFAGCLPMFIQIPFFLLIYQCMVLYRFEFQNGTFLWINPSAASATNGFIAPNLGQMDYLLIGLYAVSMVVTTLLTPVSDPTNARQQRMMGVGLAVFFSIMMFFWPLPSAFVLYWVFTNILATIQMLRAYRMPAPPLVKVNAPGGVVFPTNGSVSKAKGTPVRHRPKSKK